MAFTQAQQAAGYMNCNKGLNDTNVIAKRSLNTLSVLSVIGFV